MDGEISLEAGGMRAVVSTHGASLRRLWIERPGQPPRDLVWGYSGTANKRGGQGDVLMPFPGRVAGGAYRFAGQRLQMQRNDKDGPNAIHGWLRGQAWEESHSAGSALFRTRIRPTDHEGYPFDVEAAVGYELLPTGLACAFVMRNGGTSPAPVGAGFHPYISTPGGADETVVRVPAATLIEFRDLLPTGRVVDVPGELDFRSPRRVGATRLNHCFAGLVRDSDGFLRAHVGDVEVWMDRSFPYLVLYTGDALGPDARKALAVEPMTCATDALNHPEWGLCVLQPGEAFTGTWGIGLRPGR